MITNIPAEIIEMDRASFQALDAAGRADFVERIRAVAKGMTEGLVPADLQDSSAMAPSSPPVWHLSALSETIGATSETIGATSETIGGTSETPETRSETPEAEGSGWIEPPEAPSTVTLRSGSQVVVIAPPEAATRTRELCLPVESDRTTETRLPQACVQTLGAALGQRRVALWPRFLLVFAVAAAAEIGVSRCLGPSATAIETRVAVMDGTGNADPARLEVERALLTKPEVLQQAGVKADAVTVSAAGATLTIRMADPQPDALARAQRWMVAYGATRLQALEAERGLDRLPPLVARLEQSVRALQSFDQKHPGDQKLPVHERQESGGEAGQAFPASQGLMRASQALTRQLTALDARKAAIRATVHGGGGGALEQVVTVSATIGPDAAVTRGLLEETALQEEWIALMTRRTALEAREAAVAIALVQAVKEESDRDALKHAVAEARQAVIQERRRLADLPPPPTVTTLDPPAERMQSRGLWDMIELNPWTETWHLGDNSPGGEFDVPRAAECLYARV